LKSPPSGQVFGDSSPDALVPSCERDGEPIDGEPPDGEPPDGEPPDGEPGFESVGVLLPWL